MRARRSILAAYAADVNPKNNRDRLLAVVEDWLRTSGEETYNFSDCIFVGGSAAKEVSDDQSDVDITIVTPTLAASIQHPLVTPTQDIFFPIASRRFTHGEAEIDLRVVGADMLGKLVHRFQNGEDVSLRLQDLLWNIRFGLYFKGGLEGAILDIEDSYQLGAGSAALQKLRNRLHEMCNSLIYSVAAPREDYLQYLETRVRAEKLFLLIGYFLLKEGFWGYKNTHLIQKMLPDICQAGIEASRQWSLCSEKEGKQLISVILASQNIVSEQIQ